MFLVMHGLSRSTQTAGEVLGLSTGTRTNDMFKKQQANDQRKIMDTTIILNQPVRYMTSMFEKIKAYYRSLISSYLHMVLEKKSTTLKFLSFQYMYKQLPK